METEARSLTTDLSSEPGSPTDLAVAKLTALWALSEGGLGGILHAMRLPLRGVILACIAAMTMCLIGHITRRPRAVLQAALLVIAAKAVLAPHSPWSAHMAVLLQGILGSLALWVFGPSLIGCMLVGALCLLETSVHTLIWLSLLGGADFWTGLNRLGKQIQADVVGRILVNQPAQWLVTAQIVIHLIPGLIAGLFAWWLPGAAGRLAASGGAANTSADPTPSAGNGPSYRRRRRPWRRVLTVVICILVVIAPSLISRQPGDSFVGIVFALVRAVVVVALTVFVIGPVVGYIISRLIARTRQDQHFAQMLPIVDAARQEVTQVWALSAQRPFWKRLPYCLAVLFARAIVIAAPGG